MTQCESLYLAEVITKSAMATGGMFRGGMGAAAVRQGRKVTNSKFKAFSKAFRPPKNPFSAVNPSEIQRLAELKQTAPFGGNRIVQGARNSMAAKNPAAPVPA